MNFLQRIFAGRHGSDQLGIALLVGGLVSMLLASLIGSGLFATIFRFLYYAMIILCLFRMLSRNTPKRQQENDLFMEKTEGIRSKLPGRGRQSESRAYQTAKPRVKKDRANYRYLKCPNCRQPLRVPRGKGNIKIKCAKCDLEFMKKV